MAHRRAGFLTLVSALLLAAGPALGQTGTITGRVTSAETGAALGGARVEAIAADGRSVSGSLTDGSGGYRLSVPAGSYTVQASLVGYAAGRIAGVTVSGGQSVTPPTIALQPQAVVLDPVVVSASRQQERALEAPARVEVVSTQEIEARPALTPADHLRSTPGVDIATTGLQSSNVAARGFNNIFSGSLHMLTDHRIAGVPSLRVNLLQLVPLTDEDLERIEVVLGPGAALYGPNTANGVLHMFTKSPLDSQGSALSVSTGERNVIHATGRSALLLGENLGVKVSGQFLRGDEWTYSDPAEGIERAKFAADLPFFRTDLMRAAGIDEAEATRRIERIGAREADVARWSVEGRADWRVRPGAVGTLSVGTTSVASGVELTGLGAAQVRDWMYTYYQARFNWNRLFAQAYLNTSNAGETYLLRNGAPIVDRSKMFVSQVQHGVTIGSRQNFVYGADLLLTLPETEGTINGIYEDDDETRELGAYLQSATELTDRLDLVLAGRLDTHSALPKPIFSPRAALVFTPTPEHALRLTFNRAFSTPNSLNQFLDLGSSIPNAPLARLGYSLRIQGTGDEGFTIRQANGGYLMRSPFTPAAAGGPAQLVPADAAAYWAAAVQVVGQRAALNPALVAFLASLRPTSAQIGTNYLDVVNAPQSPRPLSELALTGVDPIRESTSNTIEAGYKGIFAERLLLAADVWWSRRENLVTPLTVATPLLLMNGQQVGAFLVPQLVRFFMQAGMSEAQARAQAAAAAPQLAAGLASVPVGVISSPDINASGGQLLMTYTNVDEDISLWGSDLSATALLTPSWSLGVSGSFTNQDVFETSSGMKVMLNAPKKRGSVTLGYADSSRPISGELRVRYNDQFPVSSGVYVGTRCIGDTSALAEDCVDSYALLDLSLGYRLPFRRNAASLDLFVQNLLDEEYRSFPGAPTIGRLAVVRLKYQF